MNTAETAGVKFAGNLSFGFNFPPKNCLSDKTEQNLFTNLIKYSSSYLATLRVIRSTFFLDIRPKSLRDQSRDS